MALLGGGFANAKTTGAPSIESMNAILEEDPSDVTTAALFEHRGLVKHESPFHKLAFAVLMDALDLIQKCPPNRRKQREFQDAYLWFLDDAEYTYSFTTICDYLDLPADPLRRGVLRLLQRIDRGEFVPAQRARRGALHAVARMKIGGAD